MKLSEMFDNLDELRIDNKHGWGAVPDNQNVDYKGLRVHVKPSMFLRLAHELERPFSAGDIENHIRANGSIGAPFLMIAIPQDWFERDLTLPAEIYGHEGRNRMIAILKVEGDIPVETHLFFGGGLRNRDLTPEIVDRLNRSVISQRGNLVNGPWFEKSVNESDNQTGDGVIDDEEIIGRLNEIRSNPERNPKRSTSDVFNDYLHRYGEGKVYVHFGKLEKVGINPQSSNMFGPHGVYGYPLENAATVLKDPYLPKRAVYANVIVPTPGARILDLDKVPVQRMKELLSAAVTFHRKKIKDKTNAYERYLDASDTRSAYEGIKRLLSDYSRRRGRRLSLVENAFFRSQGYDAIRDTGRIMNDNPNQIVFLVPSAYKVIERIPLRLEGTVNEVAKVRISKDPNDLGAYVHDEGAPEPTVMLNLSDITSVLEPDDYHAEKPGASERIAKMVKAIEDGKKLPPMIVRRYKDGYQVLDGHHRFKAYRLTKTKRIPARIVSPENITGDINEARNAYPLDKVTRYLNGIFVDKNISSNILTMVLRKSDIRFDKNPELRSIIDNHSDVLIDRWDSMKVREHLREVGVAGLVYEIATIVGKGYKAPWLLKYINDNKEDIIRSLLTCIRNGRKDDMYFVEYGIPKLRKLKLGWPELDVISRSLKASKKLGENFNNAVMLPQTKWEKT